MNCEFCKYDFNGKYLVRECKTCRTNRLLGKAYSEFLDKAEIICKDNGIDLKEVLDKQFKNNPLF